MNDLLMKDLPEHWPYFLKRSLEEHDSYYLQLKGGNLFHYEYAEYNPHNLDWVTLHGIEGDLLTEKFKNGCQIRVSEIICIAIGENKGK